MNEIFLILVGSILINNVVLSSNLGICPFLGVSNKIKTASGMGVAVIFVITLASFISYLVYNYLLVPFELEYLSTIAFILVIASLVQFVELVVQKTSPILHSALGIYLPLITTNCAVLGIAMININKNYSLLKSVVNGFGAAVGFAMAIVLMAGIRERIEKNDIPKAFRGFPILLITAGLMALAFLGFKGMIQ